MNIALMAEDSKKELMVQFCIAYCGILAHHTICATDSTGRLVAEATGLPVHRYLSHAHGGIQQIGARLDLNEIDMVLFFKDPGSDSLLDDVNYPSPATLPPLKCSFKASNTATWTGATS